jgi:hypothetical protein
MKRIAANFIYWPFVVAKVVFTLVWWIFASVSICVIVGMLVWAIALKVWGTRELWLPCLIIFLVLTPVCLGIRVLFRWAKENRK